MARRIPENRFDQLVRGATEVFIAGGYRLTQMSDIAQAIGVAKGTLYGYVESKDSLLTLCLIHADAVEPIALPEVLPVPTLPPGQLGQMVKERLGQQIELPILARALDTTRAEDPAAELRAVIGEFFDLMFDNRHAIKLLDRCGDHPEIRDLWQTEGREQPRLMIARYLELRAGTGQFRAFSDVRIAARVLIETVATWAVHIHWDRMPERLDAAASRETTIDFLVSGFVA
jgi:AcrR family transcriptional regulator